MNITVLTPTYNRSKLLGNLFHSLLIQNNYDFEWIIVDDGSTDDTKTIVEEFNPQGKFLIHYIRKNNGGKHTAINIGLEKAQGKFIFIVDSDDFLLPNSIALLNGWIKEMPNDPNIIGVCGRCVYPDGSVIGSRFDFPITVCDSITIRQKYKIRGDLAEVYRTSILKKYPFPEFPNERFLSEAVVWNRIASQGYKLVYRNVPIKVCEYLPQGLSRNIRHLHRASPKGTMLFYNEIIRAPKFNRSSKIKAAINYWRYTWNKDKRKYIKELKPIKWTYLLYAFGVAFFIKDNCYRRNRSCDRIDYKNG